MSGYQSQPRTFTLADGSTPATPQITDRDDLDLSELRRHCLDHHHIMPGTNRRAGHGRMPRSNQDLVSWHWAQHHRYYQSHLHRGLWTLVRDKFGRTTGQIPRPLGWFTGQLMLTRVDANAEFRVKHVNDTSSAGET